MRRKSEVISIPDIRERNDRPKDKQPKHQAASTVQRQMVQKFVKELNENTKQSDRSNSAETTATEQVEMTAREIVHEAAPFPRKAHHRTNAPHTRPERPQPQSIPTPTPQEQGRRTYVQRAKKSRTEKPSARDNLYTEQPEIRPADDWPDHEPPPIREKPDIPEIRGQVQSEAAPAKPSVVRHVKQPDTWIPCSAATPVMRGKEQSIRERPAVTPAQDLPPTPQTQAQQTFAKKQTQLTQNPSIESIYPSEPAAPILSQPPVSVAPAITPERQPVTAGSGKSASPTPQPVQPLAEHPPTIREKPKPNAALREKSRRGVDIRTRDTEQISAPTAQPKTPVSKIDTKRARKAATQDAQRKMLKKSNNRAASAAAAAAKKLAEAAAKALKELISALASLGGGTALFIVFSIVIVAGAFLASPLGILFADEQESDNSHTSQNGTPRHQHGGR